MKRMMAAGNELNVIQRMTSSGSWP